MKLLFLLAWKSLKNRRLATSLSIIGIALSVALLLGVEKARNAAEDGFMQTIAKTDLIVGARSGPIQLLLYTVFNMGSATHNISYETFEHFKKLDSVEWMIPYSLGDGHRGFRVVGTNNDFFKYYRYRGDKGVELQSGQEFNGMWDVVVGAEVARSLKYKIGDSIIIAHGVTKGEGIQKHDDKPFKIVGILSPTGTPLDRAVYISLIGLEAVHLDWAQGIAPSGSALISQSSIKKDQIKIKTITAFFLRTKNRIETLRLQREINTYKDEALLAIIPGVVLSELWNGLSVVGKVLKSISFMVVCVGLMSMLISLITTLNERRREMAILRAIGASFGQITCLLVIEATFITVTGIIIGVLGASMSVFFLGPWLENEYGLFLHGPILSLIELYYLLAMFLFGLLVGLLPGYMAQRQSLKDGLSVKL